MVYYTSSDIICPKQDQTAQLFLAILQIILTFIVGILTSVRMRARCPCGGEISSKPASAPYSPGSLNNTPVPISVAATMRNDSKEDLIRPKKAVHPLSSVTVIDPPYHSPDMESPSEIK